MVLLKSIPKIDKFINDKDFKPYSTKLLTKIVKEKIDALRQDILNEKINEVNLEALKQEIIKEYESIIKPSLRPLINATGVIIHTNLGRSLINEKTFENIKKVVTSYNNLEYDVQKGKRGERYTHISKVICSLLDCEDVLIVNNNASAVFLILNTFAKNKEVIVSRGELVEIGGSFRVPEVMAQSGAILKEVGATNKTHLYDYEDNINENTAMLMKVHKSNYSIEGFTSEVSCLELVKLAKEKKLLDYYDMGSGHLVDLPYNLDQDEPSVLKLLENKPSLLSFSGDKLLGSVQAGIIVGKKELISKLKKNHLLRMLRVDKITLAILEENVKSILLDKKEDIPTLEMLFTSTEVLERRALRVKEAIKDICQTSIFKTHTVLGGGTTPNKKIPTIVLSLAFKNYKENKIEKLLRSKGVIGRMEKEQYLLDFRAIKENELETLISIIKEIINE